MAGRSGATPLRLAIGGQEATALRRALEAGEHHIELADVPAGLDVFTIDSIDAVVVADENPARWIETVRDVHPYQPVVVVEPAPGPLDAAAFANDEYTAVVKRVEGRVPTALVVTRARRLAAKPRTGTRQAGDGSRPPLHRERPRVFYALWGLATLAYGVGDTVTTIYGIEVEGIVEHNPIVDVAVESLGLAGLVGIKLIAFFILLGLSLRASRVHSRVHYYWPPVVLAIAGTGLTVWNAVLILG